MINIKYQPLNRYFVWPIFNEENIIADLNKIANLFCFKFVPQE